ncbi:zinc finger CCCH domain-containing protein [Salix suchowensis]|nr:zinc finger CCCH domain-containing protein [Salix suchowensis]
MKKETKDKKAEIVKERDCEDWCFVCKDGGELILCDFDDCLKVYHTECVKKGDSFPGTGQKWTCARHSCTKCHKAPKLYCYCCPKAVCSRCIRAAKFLSVRGNKGLCEECLEYVHCVEDKDDVDADGGEIDLTDRDTYECLFLEYWEIIKEVEGLTWDDVNLADLGLRKHSKRSFKSTKFGKSKNDGDWVIYDSDLEINEAYETRRKRKGSKSLEFDSDLEINEAYETRRKRKGSKPIEFDGWGSKQLLEFLTFLGKDTTKELSEYEVNTIICAYIQEKELLDPVKKKKVICDEKLYSIFRRKSMYKNAILNLLEYHFTANLIDSHSEEDENIDGVEISKQEKSGKSTITFKRQNTRGSRTKSEEIEAVSKLYESGLAAIVTENIKLVYLRKSLVEELSKEPESFEGKIVGSFVKVKNDSRDPNARNSYQLSQVTGIKQSSVTGENKSEILLRVSSMPTDVCFSMLSDLDLSEDEIEDLRQNVEDGLHPKPSIVELEQKAKQLHVDIKKHWIEKELVRLQKRIDLANEKGWRREYPFMKPSEQERLLQQSPEVIHKMVECKTSPKMLQK